MTTCARAGGCAGSNYTFLTQKERDIETGFDYFLARYYASIQGRFTGADPYDINIERQETSDPEKADALFADYIGQPQHWNHYAYALNNPLLYVDPDGRKDEVYFVRLLDNDKFKVTISDKIKPEARAGIKQNINDAIEKINSGQAKLSPEQTKAINNMDAIRVTPDIPYSYTDGRTFNILPHRVLNSTLDGLTGDIIHDSHHADQNARGLSYNEKTACDREREASAFAVDVGQSIGLSSKSLEVFRKDAITGHTPFKNKTCTPKTRIP